MLKLETNKAKEYEQYKTTSNLPILALAAIMIQYVPLPQSINHHFQGYF